MNQQHPSAISFDVFNHQYPRPQTYQNYQTPDINFNIYGGMGPAMVYQQPHPGMQPYYPHYYQ